MEFSPEKKRKLTGWILGIASACILLYLSIKNIGVLAKALNWCLGIVFPLLLGVAFAMILNVPMRFFESHLWKNTNRMIFQKVRRPIAFFMSLFVIIGILLGLIWIVIPELVNAIKIIIQGVVEFIKAFSTMDSNELAELPLGNILLNVDWDEILNSLQIFLKEESGTIVNIAFGTVASLISGVFDFIISFVFSIYILFSKDKLKNQLSRSIRAWLPKTSSDWLIHAASVANENFRNFISGQSLEALILGVLCMLGMILFGFPYAPMLGALVGVTALIPVVGGFIGAGVGAFMILTVDPIKAVFFIIYIIVLQQLEGNIIYPRVMGSRVNLSGMWILASVTIGGGIGGPIGMLLAVPIASTIYTLFKEATIKRENRINEVKNVKTN